MYVMDFANLTAKRLKISPSEARARLTKTLMEFEEAVSDSGDGDYELVVRKKGEGDLIASTSF